MPRIEVNRKAPVVGTAEAHIEAPVEVVWRILSDLDGWLAKLLPGLMKRTLAKALDQGMAALKAEAEFGHAQAGAE